MDSLTLNYFQSQQRLCYLKYFACINMTNFLTFFYFPAPLQALSPRPLPFSKPDVRKPESEASDDDKRSNLIIVVGICAGVLIIFIISMIIICSCTSGKRKKAPVKELGISSNLRCLSSVCSDFTDHLMFAVSCKTISLIEF